ncbi:serine/threonine-protein kinase [Nocardiopsis algeriensis]|uniref:Protein kinase domain-containing protein n=1 Tax=Nocardiopsis algeriensis TaxID=1478215 RepID=A0A841IKV4_9ACTN|nr:serine/threonine-protein kinase [Nocardiopsis algeriensis]MBB6119357.1 hypothetical protein [Nocardiopsis algeriensis]
MSPRSPREISVLVPEHLPPLYPDDPARIGPYLVLGRMGQGTTGTVYAAVDTSSPTAGDRLVAVKVLKAPELESPGAREALNRRLLALSQVDPARVVVPTAFDCEATPPWILLPYMEGERLSHYVTKRGGLGTGKLIALATGLAEGLAALHARGVAHGSLRPDEVLLESRGPHIMECALPASAENLRGSGATWLSPERLAGGEADAASDVFAWGAVVAFAGTGRLPFGTGEPEEISARAAAGEFELSGLAKGLQPLVGRALDPDPSARPSLHEVMGAAIAVWQRENPHDTDLTDRARLAHILEREWSAVEPPPRVPRVIRLEGGGPRRPSRAVVVAGAGAAALAVVGGAVWGASQVLGAGSREEPAVPAAQDPSPSPAAEEDPLTLVVRFDPAEQENVLEGPWIYTPVDRDDEPVRGQGVPAHTEWAEQWDEAGEPAEAVISPEAEVLCAKFCAAPEHVFIDDEGRGTWELTGADFINYLSWGPVVVVEVTFAEEEGEGPREIVQVTELFTD